MKSERRRQNNKRRRQQQLKRNIIMTMFSILLVLTLSLAFFTFGSKAQDNEDIILYRYYTNIEVQYGETLTDIAAAYYCPEKYSNYDEYITDVMLVNGLYCKEISAGSFLLVPYYSSEFK